MNGRAISQLWQQIKLVPQLSAFQVLGRRDVEGLRPWCTSKLTGEKQNYPIQAKSPHEDN